MTPEGAERAGAIDDVPSAVQLKSLDGLVDGGDSIDLTPEARSDLLDLRAWSEILKTYGRTTRVAVALTDPQGQLLGAVHNPQPVWTMVHDALAARPARPDQGAGCPFCLTTRVSCTAVADAFHTGTVVMVRDQAGLTHVAVPLLLGKEQLGAIVAGQVFDRYPEPLPLRRVAMECGIPAQHLWEVARKQHPVSAAILQASGDLLCALGGAFLLQRYGAILESKLAETNGRFRLLVEGVRDYALFTMDLAGHVTSWNGGAERMLGYSEAQIVGQECSRIYTPEDIQNRLPEKQLRQALQEGLAEEEGWRVRGNGKQFLAHVNITPMLEGGRVVRGFAVIMQDVTERRKLAIVLEAAQHERSLLQERFLSHVSHELRTPLTAIYFFITNLVDGLLGEVTAEQREHLSFALDNVNQLKDMVSDLLDITRLNTDKLTIEPQQASAVKLVAEVFSTCRTSAALKNISLWSNIAHDAPFLWVDPVRVRQILINLIENGIKFTPEIGAVSVGTRPFAEGDEFLCLSVSDTGQGISAENCQIVFDRLAQVKSSTDASRSGLGLGLFITRELVQRHGGRIWVESELGRGSTFFLTLPVFSLARLCEHIFTAECLVAGVVILISVDVAAIEGAAQSEILSEIRKVLERCIHPGQDVLLPSLSDADPVRTFFIVACTDLGGSEIIGRRIVRELQHFDSTSTLKPVIASTMLRVIAGKSRDEQVGDVTARIERLVRAHVPM